LNVLDALSGSVEAMVLSMTDLTVEGRLAQGGAWTAAAKRAAPETPEHCQVRKRGFDAILIPRYRACSSTEALGHTWKSVLSMASIENWLEGSGKAGPKDRLAFRIRWR
jgi:hypothetical protein